MPGADIPEDEDRSRPWYDAPPAERPPQPGSIFVTCFADQLALYRVRSRMTHRFPELEPALPRSDDRHLAPVSPATSLGWAKASAGACATSRPRPRCSPIVEGTASSTEVLLGLRQPLKPKSATPADSGQKHLLLLNARTCLREWRRRPRVVRLGFATLNNRPL